MRSLLLFAPLLLPLSWGCYGVPEDTHGEALRAQAWGGSLPACVELGVDLEGARMAVGACDAVDPTLGVQLPFEAIDALRAGIDDSEFSSENVEPEPGCPSCPTRSYRVTVASQSAGLRDEMRILPSDALVRALAPLGAP